MENDAPRHVVIGAHILFYGMACTLLAAVALAALMGWVAWSTTRELAHLQDDLKGCRDAAGVCRIALERSDAEVNLYERWLSAAKGLHRK